MMKQASDERDLEDFRTVTIPVRTLCETNLY